MLDVRFFARIREQLGETQLRCAHVETIDELIDALSARGTHWSEALRAPNVIIAVNQAVVERSQALCDGDEVAFFPPVTGG